LLSKGSLRLWHEDEPLELRPGAPVTRPVGGAG